MYNKNIIEQCLGCEHIQDSICEIWQYPAAKWRLGNCTNATHIEKKSIKTEKIRIGQQKSKKYKKE